MLCKNLKLITILDNSHRHVLICIMALSNYQSTIALTVGGGPLVTEGDQLWRSRLSGGRGDSNVTTGPGEPSSAALPSPGDFGGTCRPEGHTTLHHSPDRHMRSSPLQSCASRCCVAARTASCVPTLHGERTQWLRLDTI